MAESAPRRRGARRARCVGGRLRGVVGEASRSGLPRPAGASVRVVALAVAAILLVLTGAATLAARSLTDGTASTRRTAVANEAAGQFEREVRRHLDLVRATEGLYEGSDQVEPAEFAGFAEVVGVDERYPAAAALAVVDEGGAIVVADAPGTPHLPAEATTALLTASDGSAVEALTAAELVDGIAGVAVPEPGAIVLGAPVDGDDGGSWVLLVVDPVELLAATLDQTEDLDGLVLTDRATGQPVGAAGVEPTASASVKRPDLALGEWQLALETADARTALESRTAPIVLLVGLLATATATSLVVALARSRREAVQLSETLRVSEETARLVIDRAPVAIIEMDGDVVARANPRARALLGADRLGVGAVPTVQVVDPVVGRRPLHEVATESSGDPGRTPLLLVDPVEGGAVEVLADRVDLGGGSTLVVVDDVSAREEATRQQIQAQRMEAMGLLAGGVAHDFNNLLSIISGYTELVLRAEQLDPLDRESLEEAQRATDRAADVVAELLALTRRTELPSESMDLNAAVTEMSAMIIRVVGAPIEVDFDLLPEPVRVRLDPARLEQMVVNLVLNARDAMPTGGQLGIATRIDGPFAELTVVDTGAGMSEHVRAHLFDPFFTTKASGTGLGLPMVATILREAGGEVDVTSTPDLGTTFVLRIPLAPADLDVGPAEVPATNVPADATTVLLVEDEPALLKLLATSLRSAGFAVTTAPDAEAAAEAAERQPPMDLLVTDVILPGRTGIELAAQLRETQPDLRILLVSGYAKELLPQNQDLPEGALLLRKPFTRDALLDAIGRLQQA